MKAIQRYTIRLLSIGALAAAGFIAVDRADSHQAGPGAGSEMTLSIDGDVALHSFMALSDAHLQKLADVLRLLATTDAIRSGTWERIRGPLAAARPMVVPAVLWFARPNGDYSAVAQAGTAGNLSDRPYFPRALAGQTILGDLVVSRSTSRNTAIVAVPVRGRDDKVIGVLGASVYLDSLGALIREQMGGLGGDLRFFAIDAQPIGALNSDPALIFTEPMKLGDEGMRKAFTEILSRPEGVVTYAFRGRERTMLFMKSPVTGWWYAFGAMRG